MSKVYSIDAILYCNRMLFHWLLCWSEYTNKYKAASKNGGNSLKHMPSFSVPAGHPLAYYGFWTFVLWFPSVDEMYRKETFSLWCPLEEVFRISSLYEYNDWIESAHWACILVCRSSPLLLIISSFYYEWYRYFKLMHLLIGKHPSSLEGSNSINETNVGDSYVKVSFNKYICLKAVSTLSHSYL